MAVTFGWMVQQLRASFAALPDHRRGQNTTYTIADAAASAFSVFRRNEADSKQPEMAKDHAYKIATVQAQAAATLAALTATRTHEQAQLIATVTSQAAELSAVETRIPTIVATELTRAAPTPTPTAVLGRVIINGYMSLLNQIKNIKVVAVAGSLHS